MYNVMFSNNAEVLNYSKRDLFEKKKKENDFSITQFYVTFFFFHVGRKS